MVAGGVRGFEVRERREPKAGRDFGVESFAKADARGHTGGNVVDVDGHEATCVQKVPKSAAWIGTCLHVLIHAVVRIFTMRGMALFTLWAWHPWTHIAPRRTSMEPPAMDQIVPPILEVSCPSWSETDP